jgi:hypothetical protein
VAPAVVTNPNDSAAPGSGSLRAAINTGDSTITFAPGVTTANVTLGELLINHSVTIQGPSGGLETIQGNGTSRIFHVNPGNLVVLNNLQIQGGMFTAGAAAEVGGGGIFNEGNLTLNNDQVTDNTVVASVVGGFDANGGGIDNTGTLAVNASTIDQNTANGAGLAGAAGGGVRNQGSATFTNCTIALNTSTATGAFAAFGGGVQLFNGATATLINSTVSNNTASSTGSDGGGIRVSPDATNILNLLNSIVANNNASNAPDIGIDAPAPPAKAQGDVFGNTSGFTIQNLGNNITANPQLGPLQDNGGPTPTEAIPTTSPAFLHGVSSGSLGIVPTVDQRGNPRLSSMPGAGAFAPTVPTTLTVTSVSEQYTLFSQIEGVSVRLTFANSQPLAKATVTITDNGQTQTVTTDSNGNATATFTFNLFQGQEQPKPHAITASFTGGSGAVAAFASNSMTTNSPDTTFDFQFQLFFVFAFFQALQGGGA